MVAEGTQDADRWSAAVARIPVELRSLRLRFGADWAVVWGPLPIEPTAAFASVLFEDRDEARPSALGIAVPIVGNPWAESLFTNGGALADDPRHDPRLRLHEWIISHNRIVAIASGAALRDGMALGIVELYAQRPFTLPAEPIYEIQQVALRIAEVLEQRPMHSIVAGPANGPRDPITAAALHDLKSSLAAQSLLISSFEKELRAVVGGATPNPARVNSMLESLSVMRESVVHANELTRVMTLGSLAPGTRVAIDLPSIAKLALAAIPMDLRERFDVIIDPSITLARPVIDAPSMLRAIVNLVQNGALSIQRVKGARAKIRVHPEGESAIVEVEDEGPGVAPEIAPRLFQPGVTTHERSDGHGYGLHTARRAIESMGGTLTLYSIPRHGAKFIIRVPRSAAGL